MLTDEVYQCMFCDKPGKEYFTVEPDPKWDDKVLYTVALEASTIPMCDGHAEVFIRFRRMYRDMEK